MSQLNLFFNAVLDRVAKNLPYQASWKDEQGYFDLMVDVDLGLAPGQIAKSICPDGHHLIILGTAWGNLVVTDIIHNANFALIGAGPQDAYWALPMRHWTLSDIQMYFVNPIKGAKRIHQHCSSGYHAAC